MASKQSSSIERNSNIYVVCQDSKAENVAPPETGPDLPLKHQTYIARKIPHASSIVIEIDVTM